MMKRLPSSLGKMFSNFYKLDELYPVVHYDD